MNKEVQACPDNDSPSPGTLSGADWALIAHRELVSRVVASSLFARSERLNSFLIYICDMTLKGRQIELNEQNIGHAVFGRKRDYDSSVDGIVRTQASRLRQRLDLYFEQEGSAEPVRIVIPRGRYVPQFLPRLLEEQLHLQTVPERVADFVAAPQVIPGPAPSTAESAHYLRSVPWLLCLALLCVITLLLARNRHAAAAAPNVPLNPLWSRIFTPGQPTLEVPADSGLVLSHMFDQRTISLQEYLSGDYRRPNVETAVPLSSKMQAMRVSASQARYTTIVDLDMAVSLGEIAQAAHSQLKVRYARDIRPNDLKNGNIIIMGASESNPWVDLFERNMNFNLRNDYSTHSFFVVNKAPHPGEPQSWASRTDDPQRTVYGVIAFVPNLSGSGNALVIEGTSMAGTEAAWDFISDDAELMPFLRRIQHPDGSIPHFELVLGTQNMSSSAVRSNLLAWRVTD